MWTSKDILDALKYGKETLKNAPLFKEGKDLSKWKEITTHSFYKPALQEVVQTGEEMLDQPIPQLPFSVMAIYERTGSRKEYERLYFNKRLRLNTFAVLSLAYDDSKYIEALEDILWSICDEFTWCLPAHLSMNPLLTVTNAEREHKEVIDLFAAETGFALAEVLYLVGDRIHPRVVQRVKTEIRDRIMKPYCDLKSAFHWETLTMNWAAVCAGSIGIAALYMYEDDATLLPIVQRVIGSLQCFISGYADDGVCTEGLGYWTYGFGFYVYFAELLKERTGGKLDLMQGEKIKQISLFQQKCYLTENFNISFSDANPRSNFQMGLTQKLQDLFPELDMPDPKYSAGFLYDNARRWGHAVRSLVWSRPYEFTGALSDSSYYLEDAEWLVSRKRMERGIVCLAAKSGHNDEPHNHNDIGSFQLHIDGENLLVDLGCGQYTREYFQTETRYSFLCNGSQGHSVPIINGQLQKEGAEYRGRVLDVVTSPERDLFAVDMAGAYFVEGLKTVVRTFDLCKEGVPSLTITDDYVFGTDPESIEERFVTQSRTELVRPGRVHIYGKQRTVFLTYDSSRMDCSIEKTEFATHLAGHHDVILLTFKLLNPGQQERVEFHFEWE